MSLVQWIGGAAVGEQFGDAHRSLVGAVTVRHGSGRAEDPVGRFLRAIARRGTVGGTARWAAMIYHRAAQRPEIPSSSPREIVATLLDVRYRKRVDRQADERNATILQLLSELHAAGRIAGVAHLVALILTAEADLQENVHAAEVDFMDVIVAELRQKGVPDVLVFGRRGSQHPAVLIDIYEKSMRELANGLKMAGVW